MPVVLTMQRGAERFAVGFGFHDPEGGNNSRRRRRGPTAQQRLPIAAERAIEQECRPLQPSVADCVQTRLLKTPGWRGSPTHPPILARDSHPRGSSDLKFKYPLGILPKCARQRFSKTKCLRVVRLNGNGKWVGITIHSGRVSHKFMPQVIMNQHKFIHFPIFLWAGQ